MKTDYESPLEHSSSPNETAKHTPTPWHVHSNYRGGIPLSVGSLNSPHGSVTIARVDWLAPRATDRPSPEVEANAAHIVLCVNSHDALLVELKALVEIICGNQRNVTLEDCDSAKAVIAAAEGKP